jgi:hypothetical protein
MTAPIPLVLWLTGLAALIVILWQASVWMKRWQGKHEKGEEPYRQPNDEDSEEGTKIANFRTISTRLYAIAHQLHTQKEQYRRSERDNASRSIITIVCIAMTAVLAFGSDWIFYDQLSEMQIERRAWLAPIAARIEPDSFVDNKNALVMTVDYQNTGKEPALDFNATGETGTVPIQAGLSDWNNMTFKDNHTCDGLYPKNGGATTYPSAQFVSHYRATLVEGDEQITREVQLGERVLWVNGCFAYRTLDSIHTSAFCFYLEPNRTKPILNWQFNPCSSGNWAK